MSEDELLTELRRWGAVEVRTPVQLLAELAWRGVTVEPGPDGAIVLFGPDVALDHDLVADCRRLRWLLVWGLQGTRTGHAWHECSACKELQLLGRGERHCAMTHGCKGTMRPAPGPRWTVDPVREPSMAAP